MHDKVLLIDIPLYTRNIPNPYKKLLGLSVKAENIIRKNKLGKIIRGSRMYSRGMLSIASYLETHKINIKYVIYDNHFTDEMLFNEIEDVCVVGITCVTPSFHIAKTICRKIKGKNKKIICVVGGPHVTYLSKEVLQNNPEIDIVVRGEGEIPFLNLINNLDELHNVNNITYKDQLKIIQNPDKSDKLNKLPIINYNFLPNPIRDYAHNVMTTRGCSYNCNFCIDNRFNGISSHSIEDIISELKLLNNKLAPNTLVHFSDSNFGFNEKWTFILLNKMIKENFSLFFSCDMRTNTVHPEIIQKMAESNFIQINLGFEDLDDRVLTNMSKETTYDSNVRACKIIRENSKENFD